MNNQLSLKKAAYVRLFFLNIKLVNVHYKPIALITLLAVWSIFLNPIKSQSQTLSLEQCIDSALIHNKTLSTAGLDISIAETDRSSLRMKLMPAVEVTGDYKYYTDLPVQLMPGTVFGAPEGTFKEARFGVSHNLSAMVQVTFPLLNMGLWSKIKSADQLVELKKLNYEKSEVEIVYQISLLYGTTQIVKNSVTFLKKNLEQVNRISKQTEHLFKADLIKQVDVDRSHLRINQLELNLSLTEARYKDMKKQLLFLMGLPLDFQFEVEKQLAVLADERAENGMANGNFANTPMVIALAESKVGISNNELIATKRSLWPTIMLYGSYGTTGYGYDKSPNEFLNFYSIGFVGLKLSYPLFNSSVSQKTVEKKRLEADKARDQLSLIVQQNHLLQSTAESDYSVAKKRLVSSEKQLKLAESIYANSLITYENGLTSLTDLLLNESALWDAQQTHLEIMSQLIKAEITLRYHNGHIIKR